MKILKNVLFVVLCVIVFVVVLIASFLFSSQRLIQKSFEPLQAEWNDTVGTAYKDIAYGDGKYQTYDLYVPAALDHSKNYSLILFIHGGGFTGGDKAEAYREEFNRAATETGYNPIITPALKREQIKALLLEAPPIIVDGMNDRTQILYKCWYGTDDMLGLWYTRLTHIAEYVTADYIPCYITAGNTDCYPEDAKELHDRLTDLGVEHSSYFVDTDIEVLHHGYMSSFETSPHAKESLDQCMAFFKGKV